MFVFVADCFSRDYEGGAELTTQALLEHSLVPVLQIYSWQINEQTIVSLKDRHWIFGNYHLLPTDSILDCCKNLEYSIIEYDYKFCKERLPEKHISIDGKCDCETTHRGKMVSIFMAKAKNIFFMSKKQEEKYCDVFPFLKDANSKILSSVFSTETLKSISSLDVSNKNDKYLIQDSKSWVKGTSDSIDYAKKNGIKYEMFSDLSYKEMLEKFATSRGFICLPRGSDTCPRTAIEAKMLGCDLVLNDNVQHKDEEWFSGSKDITYKYMKSRSDSFWKDILETTGMRLPKDCTSKENTHFKIIIPVYNSKEWIRMTIRSILLQKYKNYQCIIADDMSTDETLSVVQDIVGKNDKFIVVKNTKKKYALKNIYDSVKLSNPNEGDVVVILDGDDWLSTSGVLSKLNEYYSSENILMTFGSFVQYPDGAIGQESSEYPKEVILKNSFREVKWRASHLKTFRNSLWNRVRKEDLKDKNGNFYEVSYDQAMMLPMLEMAGEKAKYIPEILCVYNHANPNAVNKTRIKQQHEAMLEIRSKRPYERLNEEDIP